jgi:hypothetical protein
MGLITKMRAAKAAIEPPLVDRRDPTSSVARPPEPTHSWPPARPCPTCGCPFAWHSVYDRELRCGQCDPYPPAGLIGGKFLAVPAIDPDLAVLGAEADPCRPQDWRWVRPPTRWTRAMLEKCGRETQTPMEAVLKHNRVDSDVEGGSMARDGDTPTPADFTPLRPGELIYGRSPRVYFGEVAPARGLCLGSREGDGDGGRVITMPKWSSVTAEVE